MDTVNKGRKEKNIIGLDTVSKKVEETRHRQQRSQGGASYFAEETVNLGHSKQPL